MIHPIAAKHNDQPAKGNTIMIQAKSLPQFKALIEAARFSAESGVAVANLLIEQDKGNPSRSNLVYLRQQQERAAEIEKQIEILARMAAFFAQVSA
jgi:hypothetical protein